MSTWLVRYIQKFSKWSECGKEMSYGLDTMVDTPLDEQGLARCIQTLLIIEVLRFEKQAR